MRLHHFSPNVTTESARQQQRQNFRLDLDNANNIYQDLKKLDPLDFIQKYGLPKGRALIDLGAFLGSKFFPDKHSELINAIIKHHFDNIADGRQNSFTDGSVFIQSLASNPNLTLDYWIDLASKYGSSSKPKDKISKNSAVSSIVTRMKILR